MADRTIVLATNGRHAVRGLSVANRSRFTAVQEINDDLIYVVDMSALLEGATISSVTRITTGPTISAASNTTTRLSQRLKGFGDVDCQVLLSTGETKEFWITVLPRNPASSVDPYRC